MDIPRLSQYRMFVDYLRKLSGTETVPHILRESISCQNGENFAIEQNGSKEGSGPSHTIRVVEYSASREDEEHSEHVFGIGMHENSFPAEDNL